MFRSGRGTKVSAALSDALVALEVDGYEPPSREAWSVVMTGRAERIREIDELMDTIDLPAFPWQAGAKNLFIRLVPTTVTGRRFPIVHPALWQTPFANVRCSPAE
ncbi:pyridoxamine 5'-phosphate oxidase family protein [Rhodococcus sp. NPDC019627]|uniref:pyridoxamine 5'-phosphate oxidase family protein n=1 Tax=unclassified Rhodococcus (in: high G+C Gram-positive bacteria) TaxID=192944 RepID=UPI0033E73759